MVQMKVEKPEQVKHSSFQIQLTQNYIKYTAIKVGTAWANEKRKHDQAKKLIGHSYCR